MKHIMKRLTKAQVRRRIKKVFAVFRKIPLKNRDFSIISNNCWGGLVYDKYALPYRSPTIGLYFYADEYIRFVSNLKKYLASDLEFISIDESKHKDSILEKGENSVLIGLVGGDVEVVFLHYHSKEEAYEKWTRRCKRVNFDNLIIKCNDQNGFTNKEFEEFCSLPYKNKIFFTANEEWSMPDFAHFIERFREQGYVVNDTTRRKWHFNTKDYMHIDTTQYLNSIIEE